MDILYITYFLNGFLMIAMPLVLAIYLTRRWKLSWRFWFVGAAVFLLSQVGHIPFLVGLTALFNNHILPNPSPEWKDLFNAIVLGLLAGLFEELSRYAMFRWWLKDARSWRTGVLAGAGHGGAEAIAFGLLGLYAYIQLVALRNPAILATLPAGQMEAIQTQVTAYWSTPWYLTLMGALERLLTIPVQICFSVLVLQTFVRKQWFWVWLAVLYHTVIDAVAVYAMSLLPAGQIYWIEAAVAAFTLLSLFIIFRLRPPDEALTQPTAPVAEAAPLADAPKPVAETPENLDNSRYQ